MIIHYPSIIISHIIMTIIYKLHLYSIFFILVPTYCSNILSRQIKAGVHNIQTGHPRRAHWLRTPLFGLHRVNRQRESVHNRGFNNGQLHWDVYLHTSRFLTDFASVASLEEAFVEREFEGSWGGLQGEKRL